MAGPGLRRQEGRPPPVLALLLLLLHLLALVLGGSSSSSTAAAAVAEWREERTTAPIIGIFAQPSHAAHPLCGGECEYIAASYVKWVEAAGGRALPIPYNASAPVLDALFARINGLLLPGGGNPLPEAAVHMLGRALAAHEAGDYFPVWATCLGMEWLLQAVGGPAFELETSLDAWNLSLPLDFTEAAAQSRLFRRMDPALFQAAASEPLAMNNHHKGASPAAFRAAANARLAAAFTVLSTNRDRRGQPFVSTVEGRAGLPVWGVQWHPEKPVFEWGTVADPATGQALPYEAINHSPQAQALARYTAQFFLAHARRNAHRGFSSEAEEEAVLMYQYVAVPSGPGFVQSYYFRGYPAYARYEVEAGGEEEVKENEEKEQWRRLRGARPGSIAD